jgi:triosephosphate isomerase
MRKPFIAGNWKMFKTIREAQAFVDEFKTIYMKSDVEVAICAPFTQLAALKEALKGTGIKLGAQNMHYEDNGAFTGEVSAAMLVELGVDYCIIGHSERRQYFNETDEAVNLKLHKAFAHGIIPILCVGEVLAQRDAGEEFSVVKAQLSKALINLSPELVTRLVIAYEPVWAIGTGRTATPAQANDMIGYIRQIVEELYGDDISEQVVIQYGGSVKPDNASELMNSEEIDGALVGGASLKPADFLEIINF